MTGADMLSFYSDDSLGVAYAASAAPTGAISGYVLVEHTDPASGDHDVKTVEVVVSAFTTDRTRVSSFVAGGPTGCIVTGGGLFLNGTGLKRGQLYAQLIVRRGGNAAREEIVASGYLYDARPYVALGENVEPGPGGGEGFIRTITATAAEVPAGGLAIVTVPTNALWRPKSLDLTYTATATVGTRNVRSFFDDGTTALWNFINRQPTASQTVRLRGIPGSLAATEASVRTGETLEFAEGFPQLDLVEDARLVINDISDIDPTAPADTATLNAMQVEEWLVI